jgi:hypothetical protein
MQMPVVAFGERIFKILLETYAHGPCIAVLFSSHELKAEVSFSDCPFSGVCSSVCLSVCQLTFFDDFFRTTGPILSILGTNCPLGSEFKFVQTKGIALLQGEMIAKE